MAETIEEHEMETIAQHVENEIRALFGRVAEMVGRGEVAADFGPDDVAGIPFALADAERYLTTCWREWLSCWDDDEIPGMISINGGAR